MLYGHFLKLVIYENTQIFFNLNLTKRDISDNNNNTIFLMYILLQALTGIHIKNPNIDKCHLFNIYFHNELLFKTIIIFFRRQYKKKYILTESEFNFVKLYNCFFLFEFKIFLLKF